ncbi:MAG: hypothetical protein FJ404_10490 [Verrucomicrobia bacterium]|nr:hypothetical protein [Verrucomicrobiota bacterium]
MQMLRTSGLCLGLAVLGGCATTDAESPAAWTKSGDAMVDARQAIETAPAKDKVLWQYRASATAMRKGEFLQAKGWLDDALMTLGGIHAADPSARKARGMFREEGRKRFLGEPFERSMAYYYRGILYWMDGELDNARACFQSAQFEDSDTTDKTYAGDYVLFDYLDGLATSKLGGDGGDAIRRATASARQARLPAYDREANLVLFLELGRGPRKYGDGEYGEQLKFREGESVARGAVLRVAGQTISIPAYDNLTFQATTRGGRVMDHVLRNKAVFKTGTGVAGDVGILSGAVLAHNRQTREVGLGLLAAGLVGKIVSAAANPRADLRGWDNLPQWLGFAAVKLSPGEYSGLVDFVDERGAVLANKSRAFKVRIADAPRRDSVVFISDRND